MSDGPDAMPTYVLSWGANETGQGWKWHLGSASVRGMKHLSRHVCDNNSQDKQLATMAGAQSTIFTALQMLRQLRPVSMMLKKS